MKKQILFFFLFIYFFVFPQKHCKYLVTVLNDSLRQKGSLKIIIKNIDENSFYLPKKISLCNMRLEDLEIFDEVKKKYIEMNHSKKDIDCFTFRNREKKLKPSKTYVYNINIKSDFEVLLHHGFFEKYNNQKYRFKLSFSLDTYERCGASNTLITDWIYKY